MKRALESAETDPEDAITAACSIVESVCRSILVELQLPLPAKRDIDGLVKAVQEPLNLSPARSDLPTEIAADVKQVLGGLTTTAKGIGAWRTHAGDAHGRERGFRRVDARIARLAVHAASTLALFLIEMWERAMVGGHCPWPMIQWEPHHHRVSGFCPPSERKRARQVRRNMRCKSNAA